MNPKPPQSFSVQGMAEIMASAGYDHMVVFAFKEDENGPDAVTTFLEVGIDGRNAEMAKAKRRAIGEVVFGMKDETKALDEEAKKAIAEMAEGPGSDPNQGKNLIILPQLKDRMAEKAKNPLPNGSKKKR